MATAYKKRSGYKVKHLRIDNRLEYMSKEFKELCINNGISRHFTALGTPQQNEVAERMNHTLLERLRCLILNFGLP